MNQSPLKIAYSLGFVAIILMVVNVLMSARVAQDGLVIDELSTKESQLKTNISLLEQQLLNSTSLLDLSVKAKDMGYQEPENTIAINTSMPLAYSY